MPTYKILFPLAIAVACSGENPTNINYANLSLTIVAGNAQADTVTKTLPTTLDVRVTDADAQPIQGVLVNFVVVEEGCGSAFAPAVLTNASGDASNFWTLGMLAGPCSLEARAINDLGEAVTFDTFTATAMPGPLTTGFPEGATIIAVDQLDLNFDVSKRMRDAYDNQVYWRVGVTQFAHTASLDPTEPASRMIIADSLGSTIIDILYDGQAICRPSLVVSARGQDGFLLTVDVPPKSDGGCAESL